MDTFKRDNLDPQYVGNNNEGITTFFSKTLERWGEIVEMDKYFPVDDRDRILYAVATNSLGVEYIVGPGVDLQQADLTDVDLNIGIRGAEHASRWAISNNSGYFTSSGAKLDEGSVWQPDSLPDSDVVTQRDGYDNTDWYWYEFDLGEKTDVLGVATRGMNLTENHLKSWVKYFEVEHFGEQQWFDKTNELRIPGTSILDKNGSKLFTGNTHWQSLKKNYFLEPVNTQFIRIWIKKDENWWKLDPTLRIELYIKRDDKLNLINANLIGADLTGADLIGADLTGATLTDATILRTKFHDSTGITGTPTLPANYQIVENKNDPPQKYIVGPGVDLTGADLSGVNLTDVDLTDADLTGATNFDLTGATILRTKFHDSTGITGTPTLPANYQIVENTNDPPQKYIVGPGVDLTGADLSGVNLTGATILRTKFHDSTGITGTPTLPANYQIVENTNDPPQKYIVGPGVDLTDADLTGVNLIDVDLTGADLTGANLTATTTQRTKFHQIIGEPNGLPSLNHKIVTNTAMIHDIHI